MFVNAATERSFDLIAQRASDVYRAFTPGAVPSFDDVATESPRSRPVLDPLSVSAPGEDYFVTSDDRGRTAYTRDGGFRFAHGTLVASNGRPVMGCARDGGALSPIAVDPIDDALGRIADARIEPDGSVVYDRRTIDPRNGSAQMQHVNVGRLALARFPAATKMSAAGDGSFVPPAGVVAHVGRPADANFATVAPMQREESRIDVDRSLARLHDAYVAFDALQAAHKAQGHTGKVAMDLLK